MAETTELKKSDFYFDLPQELIAQDPLEDRSSSRLLVLDKDTGEISHHIFRDIIDYLHPGDCLVLNNTKVIPARLLVFPGFTSVSQISFSFLFKRRISILASVPSLTPNSLAGITLVLFNTRQSPGCR